MFERINLVPQVKLSLRIKKLTPIVIAVAVFFGCGLVLLQGMSLKNRNARLQNEFSSIKQRVEFQQLQIEGVQRLSQTIKKMRVAEKQILKRIAHLNKIPVGKREYSKLLLSIAKSVPGTVRCNNIVFEKGKNTISGTATEYRDLPAFVESLRQLESFVSVSLQEVEQLSEDKDGFLSFSINFILRNKDSAK